MNQDRHTIYIELEDDITSLIQKLKDTSAKTVSLVPPKRSGLLQSAVNLQLVQKSALDKKQDLAVITDDQTINTIAGRIGLKTAPDLKTTPAVPELHVPEQAMPSETIEAAPAAAAPAESSAPEPKPPAPTPKTVKDKGTASGKKKLRVPDFDSFKKRLLLGLGVLLLLIGAWWGLFRVLPSAEVAIEGQTESISSELEFVAATDAAEVDLENGVVPARAEELTKTITTTFPASGERDLGERATGTISIRNCQDTNPRHLPAGTIFSAQNRNFLSNSAITVPQGQFSGGTQDTTCESDTVSVGVTAESNGDQYNLAPTGYNTSALSGEFIIEGSQMSGGVTNIATVVSAQDVAAARNELLAEEEAKTRQELAARSGEGRLFLEESFRQDIREESVTPEVNQEADEGRLIIEIEYVAISVERADLEALLRHSQSAQVTEDQAAERIGVVDTGLNQAEITLADDSDLARGVYALATTAILGPEFDFDELAAELAGMGYSEALDYLRAFPNVTGAEVRLSPFWVFSLPQRAHNIAISLEIPTADE